MPPPESQDPQNVCPSGHPQYGVEGGRRPPDGVSKHVWPFRRQLSPHAAQFVSVPSSVSQPVPLISSSPSHQPGSHLSLPHVLCKHPKYVWGGRKPPSPSGAHLLSHAPQCASLSSTLTHCGKVAHGFIPAGQPHCRALVASLNMHGFSGSRHLTSQPPQLSSSINCRSQPLSVTPSQSPLVFPTHAITHRPSTQEKSSVEKRSPLGQATPHAPQLRMSVFRFTSHAKIESGHVVCPAGQLLDGQYVMSDDAVTSLPASFGSVNAGGEPESSRS